VQGRIINGALAPGSYTASINSKKSETIRINLYVFGYGATALKNGAEVVIEKFEYLP